MMLIGLTGGIATGKSLVSERFLARNAVVIDADRIAREVVRPNSKAWKEIRKQFGEKYFNEDGELDRKALATLIFNEPSKRKLLNSIMHPKITYLMLRQLFSCLIRGDKLVVLDLPLLFESGGLITKFLHATIVVYSRPEVQMQRLMARDSISFEIALKKINSQLPLSEKMKKADFLIDNNNSMVETDNQVEDIYFQLEKLQSHPMKHYLFVVLAVAFTATIIYSATCFIKSKFLT